MVSAALALNPASRPAAGARTRRAAHRDRPARCLGRVSLRPRGSKTVLAGINLEIAAGEFVVILGETGCGKSTLLRLILGEEFPTGGSIDVDGKPVTRIDARCGYVPQKYSLFPDRTVLGNVMYGPENARSRFLGRLRPSFFGFAARCALRPGLSWAHGSAAQDYEQISPPAFGRNAAARGHCAGAAHAPAGAADGRGLQRARSLHALEPAGTIARHLAGVAAHHCLCHAQHAGSTIIGHAADPAGTPYEVGAEKQRAARHGESSSHMPFARRAQSPEFHRLHEHVKQIAFESSSMDRRRGSAAISLTRRAACDEASTPVWPARARWRLPRHSPPPAR